MGKPILAAVNEYLKNHEINISNGAIIYATIITAPSSTKDYEGEGDSAIHQPKKIISGIFE